MKTYTFLRLIYLCVFMLTGVCASVYTKAHAQSGASMNSLPLVYDPQTKKYFIGGSSKFVLKSGEASGIVERIELSLDGGDYHAYDKAIEFKSEGKHTLKFRAMNPVNSWSPVQFVEVFVDLMPPTTEANFEDGKYYKTEKGVFVSLNSTISLVSQDSLSGVANLEYSWDGKQFQAYAGPVKVEKEGTQKLYYRSMDRVGNQEPVKSIDLIADGTPPTSTMKLIGSTKSAVINNKTYVSDSVSFAIESSDMSSQVKQIWVEVDNKKTLYIKPIFFLEEGPHSLTYYSVDNVGNKESAKSVAFYTISTPPHTNVVTMGDVVNTGGINYAKRNFELKLEAGDNAVGLDHIEYKTDKDSDFKPYLEPLRFQAVDFHTVTYRAVDRVGNAEPAKTYTLNIHEFPPETSIATAQPILVRDNVSYSPAPNVITFNVSNSVVGVAKTLVSINGSPYTVYQGPITLNNDQKVYKISYKSLDKLGNEEPPKMATYNMLGATPVIDLFVTDGHSPQEQVRTNYLDQSAGAAKAAADTHRNPSGLPTKLPKKQKPK